MPKNAIVTGASKGMGEAITRHLLDRGYRVYGLSRTASDLDSETFVHVECDLSNPESIAQACASLAPSSFNLLVSNAGVAQHQRINEVTEKSYAWTFDVNIRGPILLLKALWPKLSHAHIISISSVSDRMPEENYAIYCASKAANTRFFETLAGELPEATVHVLLPDYTDTPMMHALPDDGAFSWDEILKPDDIARCVDRLIVEPDVIPSGSSAIVANEALKEIFEVPNVLFGYNATRDTFTQLSK